MDLDHNLPLLKERGHPWYWNEAFLIEIFCWIKPKSKSDIWAQSNKKAMLDTRLMWLNLYGHQAVWRELKIGVRTQKFISSSLFLSLHLFIEIPGIFSNSFPNAVVFGTVLQVLCCLLTCRNFSNKSHFLASFHLYPTKAIMRLNYVLNYSNRE